MNNLTIQKITLALCLGILASLLVFLSPKSTQANEPKASQAQGTDDSRIYTDSFHNGWFHQNDRRSDVVTNSTNQVKVGSYSIENQVNTSWGELRFKNNNSTLVKTSDFEKLQFWVKTSEKLRVKLRYSVDNDRYTSSGVDVQNLVLNEWSLVTVDLEHSNYDILPNGEEFNTIIIQSANNKKPLFYVDQVEFTSADSQATATPTSTSTPTNTPAATATPDSGSSVAIFTDEMGPNWSATTDTGAESTLNHSAPGEVYQGSTSIRTQVNGDWGSLRLNHSSLLARDHYKSVRFWVKSDQPMQIKLRHNGTGTTSGVSLNLNLNEWQQVEILISNFSEIGSAEFNTIVLQGDNKEDRPLFFIDQVELLPSQATQPQATPTPTDTPPQSCGGLEQEAETGVITSQSGQFGMQGHVVGGKEVVVNGVKQDNARGITAEDDYAEYCVYIATAGEYEIDAIVNAPNGKDDSFFIRVADQPKIIWRVQVVSDGSYISDQVNNDDNPYSIYLAKGETAFRIYMREDGAFVDRFEFRQIGSQPVETPVQTPVTPEPTQVTPVPTPVTPEPTPVSSIIQAESGTLSGGFTESQDYAGFVGREDSAGNIWSPNPSHMGEYTFSVPASGNYRIDARVLANSGTSNSFFVEVENKSTGETLIPNASQWHIKTSSDPEQRTVTVGSSYTSPALSVYLNEGSEYVFRIYVREDGTLIDHFEFVSTDAPDPTPQPTAVTPEPTAQPTTVPTPGPSVGDCDHTLQPGNISSRWPNIRSGDTICLNPGTYTGGGIDLDTDNSASNPMRIIKTPGTSGTVVFDGDPSIDHLFYIYGSHIEIGGSTINPGWLPDMVIKEYDRGIRMNKSANDIHIHHIHFLDLGENVGGSEGFAVRMNGHDVIFEYNRIEDPAADALQAETSGGTDIANWVIRYNYGHNRSDNGKYAFNAKSHSDFVQIQRGSARDIQVYGNLLIGYTNTLLLGDSWGSVTNVSVTNNFILFEANGISSSSKGNAKGTYTIENNHFVRFGPDNDSQTSNSAILISSTNNVQTNISCNVFHGEPPKPNAQPGTQGIKVSISGSYSMNSANNVESGQTSSFSEISSSTANLGYSMANARDLSNISTLNNPVNGGNCTQGASFASVNEHYNFVKSR
ncbi:MAG: hypothetical protein AAF902_15135 [Chloroflexota bacterium]